MSEEISTDLDGAGDSIIENTNDGSQENNEPKYVHPAEVRKIANKAKMKGYEEAKSEGNASFSSDDLQKIVDEKARAIVGEELSKMQNQQYAEMLTNDFAGKILQSKSNHEDFDDVINMVSKWIPNTHVPILASVSKGIDNIGDVLYDLGKNPYRLGALLPNLGQSPELVKSEIMRISAKLKNNEAHENVKDIPEPLNQIKNVSVDKNNGSNKMSTQEIRKFLQSK